MDPETLSVDQRYYLRSHHIQGLCQLQLSCQPTSKNYKNLSSSVQPGCEAARLPAVQELTLVTGVVPQYRHSCFVEEDREECLRSLSCSQATRRLRTESGYVRLRQVAFPKARLRKVGGRGTYFRDLLETAGFHYLQVTMDSDRPTTSRRTDRQTKKQTRKKKDRSNNESRLSCNSQAAHSAPARPWWFGSSVRSVRVRTSGRPARTSTNKHVTRSRSTLKPSKTSSKRSDQDDMMFKMEGCSPETSSSDNLSTSPGSSKYTKLSESELSSLRDTVSVSVKSAPLIRVGREAQFDSGSSVEDRPASLSYRGQTDISALIELRE
ncbi:hypothetical protein ACHWQZ_G013576 [Mnemiopsis leidyi]